MNGRRGLKIILTLPEPCWLLLLLLLAVIAIRPAISSSVRRHKEWTIKAEAVTHGLVRDPKSEGTRPLVHTAKGIPGHLGVDVASRN